MIFSTMTFLALFLPILVLLYFIIPRKWIGLKNTLLLIASLIFYGWGEPANVFLILACVVCTYAASFFVSKRNKFALVFGVLVNVVPLIIYKYADFALVSINQMFGLNVPYANLILPTGISFYTFQVLTYVIDLYRGKVERQDNLAYLTLYIFFFPQLIAGPIVRYSDIEEQLKERTHTLSDIAFGVRKFAFGLGRKMLANQAGLVVRTIMTQPAGNIGADMMWVGVVSYAVQIFLDFSGYSEMAIGLGYIFGFKFPENFNRPYISKSITEFWRRWHMTLSSFFRDYVYIPIGGNGRKVLESGEVVYSTAKRIRNLFIVWALTGLWHGASWNFVIWGLYFFVLLVMEKYVYGRFLERAPVLVSRLVTCFFYMIGWAIFMYDTNSVVELWNFVGRLFVGGTSVVGPRALAIQGKLIIVAISMVMCMLDKPTFIVDAEKRYPRVYLTVQNVFAVFLLVFSVVFIIGESFNPFIYFRF